MENVSSSRRSGDAPPVEVLMRDVLPGSQLPRPRLQFRRRAWLEFQRTLDPLAPPKPLRLPRH